MVNRPLPLLRRRYQSLYREQHSKFEHSITTAKMHTFGNQIGRKLRAVYPDKLRNARSARLQQFLADISENQTPVASSPRSVETGASWHDLQHDINVVIDRAHDLAVQTPGSTIDAGKRPVESSSPRSVETGKSWHELQHDINVVIDRAHDLAVQTPGSTIDAGERPVSSTSDDVQVRSNSVQGNNQEGIVSVDEQAIRDQNYIKYEGEDESDYTAGPVRIVFANDGVKDECGALLLNLDLSSKIRKAIWAQRAYTREANRAAKLDGVNFNFENKL